MINAPNVDYFRLAPGESTEIGLNPELFNSFRSAILKCRDLPEAMDQIWETTSSIIPHDRIGLSFLSKDGQAVIAAYTRASYDSLKLATGYSSGIAHSSLKPVLDEGKCRIIHNLEEYLTHNPLSVSSRVLVEEGVRSSITLPLTVDGRKVGFLFYSSKHPDVFRPEHAYQLMALIEVMSAVIEKAWMIEQLRTANEDYATLLGFVAHEMKSPLSTLTTLGYTYLEGYLGPVDDLASETISKMLRISGYLVNMISNYLGLSQLESGQMKFKPREDIPFRKEILDFTLETLYARIQERKAILNIEATVQEVYAEMDPDLMKIVMINLIDNAIKYGNEGGIVTLKYVIQNRRLIFSVENEGLGFTPEQATGLFKRFSRLRQKGLEDRKGTGLGLYLTWWIVQQHKGRISAESEPGKWARFTIELPGASLLPLG